MTGNFVKALSELRDKNGKVFFHHPPQRLLDSESWKTSQRTATLEDPFSSLHDPGLKTYGSLSLQMMIASSLSFWLLDLELNAKGRQNVLQRRKNIFRNKTECSEHWKNIPSVSGVKDNWPRTTYCVHWNSKSSPMETVPCSGH